MRTHSWIFSAETRRRQGDEQLSTFILNRGQKAAEETVMLANKMAHSHEESVLLKRSRIEALKASLEGSCVCPENGLWKRLAENVLKGNEIDIGGFCSAVIDSLEMGRSKGRNLFLMGRSNCGKSFLLRPLEKAFRCLTNPAGNLFSFAEIKGKEVVLLDDFRFSANQDRPISWSQLLLLLDGATVHFSQPRTHFVEDVEVDAKNTIPVFFTGKSVPVFLQHGVADAVETEMMRNRFRVFVFHSPIPRESMRECLPCSKCFADFLLCHASQFVKEVAQ